VLIFDLDGTLSDPLDGIWRSVNHALEHHGLGPIPRDTFGPFIGPPIDVTLRALVPTADEAGVNSLVAAFRDRYGRVGYAENELYPDVPAMLDALCAAGYRCGVCTAKRVDIARRVVEHFHLGDYFDFIDGGDVGVRKTRQLGGLLHSGRIDATAVMIGDRASDLEAAAANGLRGMGVTWGYGTVGELQGAAPWALVDTPSGLRTLLTGHSFEPD
jgi:phosphoglycolate phosphatase